MSGRSKIEWTDATWNPVRGCTKISPGCKHCYAATFAERWRGIPDHPYEHGFDLRLVPHKLVDPILWAQSRTVFVNSMSDLFHVDVPETYVHKVFGVMRLADWHVYQVLTKRADRMQDILARRLAKVGSPEPNVWLGVSVENRRPGLPRIDRLRDTPAAVRFLSIEPLLEDLGEFDLTDVDWVIVGGESGPGARPMQPEWVVSIQKQCRAAKVPFFFKQWGGVQKGRHGRELNGQTWNELPPRISRPVPPSAERRRRLEIAGSKPLQQRPNPLPAWTPAPVHA